MRALRPMVLVLASVLACLHACMQMDHEYVVVEPEGQQESANEAGGEPALMPDAQQWSEYLPWVQQMLPADEGEGSDTGGASSSSSRSVTAKAQSKGVGAIPDPTPLPLLPHLLLFGTGQDVPQGRIVFKSTIRSEKRLLAEVAAPAGEAAQQPAEV
jgi:hypothetical protein